MLKADSLTGLDDLIQKAADALIAADLARDQLIRTERRVRGELAHLAAGDNEVQAKAVLDSAVNAHADYQDAWSSARDAADTSQRAQAEMSAALVRLRLREVEAAEDMARRR